MTDTNTCSKHMTREQKARVDHRSDLAKRHFLKVEDIVYATSKYRKTMRMGLEEHEPEFEGGMIADFNDPSDWEGNTASSQAYIEMPCGCVHFISTGWLTKVKP